MWQSLPELGTGIVYAILVAAAYTFAVALAAGRGRPRLLQAAPLGAYSTSALVLFAILLLTYAFVSHDFRIRYVAHYSNRQMSTTYLLTSLWGGQDGSLLWWSLLLSGYVTACVAWLKGRYRELQPYVIATLYNMKKHFPSNCRFSTSSSFSAASLRGLIGHHTAPARLIPKTQLNATGSISSSTVAAASSKPPPQ